MKIGAKLITTMAILLLSGCATMRSQLPTQPSIDDVEAMRDFRLTNGFLRNLESFSTSQLAHPCDIPPMPLFKPKDHQMLSKAAAAYDKRPGVHAALARHGLTARRLFLGTATLRNAQYQDLVEQHPDWFKNTDPHSVGSYFHVGQQNMAFYHQHKQAINRYSMWLGREESNIMATCQIAGSYPCRAPSRRCAAKWW